MKEITIDWGEHQAHYVELDDGSIRMTSTTGSEETYSPAERAFLTEMMAGPLDRHPAAPKSQLLAFLRPAPFTTDPHA